MEVLKIIQKEDKLILDLKDEKGKKSKDTISLDIKVLDDIISKFEAGNEYYELKL